MCLRLFFAAGGPGWQALTSHFPGRLESNGSHCMTGIEPPASYTFQLLPLCVLNINTCVCLSLSPVRRTPIYSYVCVSHWTWIPLTPPPRSPLLLSKPFVSVRCFCFDAFFFSLSHLNFHPAQSGRRFRFSIESFPKPISIEISTAAHCSFSSLTLD